MRSATTWRITATSRPSCCSTPSPFEGFDVEACTLATLSDARVLAEGDAIDLGNRVFEVLHVPGHTPGSIGPVGRSELVRCSRSDTVYVDATCWRGGPRALVRPRGRLRVSVEVVHGDTSQLRARRAARDHRSLPVRGEGSRGVESSLDWARKPTPARRRGRMVGMDTGVESTVRRGDRRAVPPVHVVRLAGAVGGASDRRGSREGVRVLDGRRQTILGLQQPTDGREHRSRRSARDRGDQASRPRSSSTSARSWRTSRARCSARS